MSLTHDGMDKFKVPQCKWDSKTVPHGWWVFSKAIAAMVRTSTKYRGELLEDFLDEKLKRPRIQKACIPSYILDDPDFEDDDVQYVPVRAGSAGSGPEGYPGNSGGTDELEDDEATISEGPQGRTGSESAGGVMGSDAFTAPGIKAAAMFAAGARSMAQSGITGSSGHFSLGAATIKYKDLPPETKEFDGLMYQVLKLNITGPAVALLDNVAKPSYVQAVIVLTRHFNLSRMQRVIAAFEALDKIQYSGDPMAFQLSFMMAKREMDECKVTIMDLTFVRLMKAFDGKSKTVQFMIAKDFHRLDLTDENLNFFDLVQGYCSELAAVGDGSKGRGAFALTDAICSHCSGEHRLEDCPKLKHHTRIEVKRLQNEAMKEGRAASRILICFNCHEIGHTVTDCPLGKQADALPFPQESGGGGSKGTAMKISNREKKQAKAFLAHQAREKKAKPDTKPPAESDDEAKPVNSVTRPGAQ